MSNIRTKGTKKALKKAQERAKSLQPIPPTETYEEVLKKAQETLSRGGFAKTGVVIEEAGWPFLLVKAKAWEAAPNRVEKAKYEGILARAGWYRSIEAITEELKKEDPMSQRCQAKSAGVGIPCGRRAVPGTSSCGEHSWENIVSPSKPKETPKEEPKGKGKKSTKKETPKEEHVMLLGGMKISKNAAGTSSAAKANLNEKETPMSTKNEKKTVKGEEKVEKNAKEEKVKKDSKKTEKEDEKTKGKSKKEKAPESSEETKETKEKETKEKSKKEDGRIPMKAYLRGLIKAAKEKKGGKLGTREEVVKDLRKRYPDRAEYTVSAFLTWAKSGQIPDSYMVVEDDKGNLKVTDKYTPGGKGKKEKASKKGSKK